jgi:hypothetical protein
VNLDIKNKNHLSPHSDWLIEAAVIQYFVDAALAHLLKARN